ncbi:hypothetical protein TWF730_007449 [Orbilia blumenaviensis]|uniref:Uncharacterized protein n=1 Tax=Orbilia blumenaviensis TaxID=1796055 RepID=A0AAV9VAJ5_9PEZI
MSSFWGNANLTNRVPPSNGDLASSLPSSALPSSAVEDFDSIAEMSYDGIDDMANYNDIDDVMMFGYWAPPNDGYSNPDIPVDACMVQDPGGNPLWVFDRMLIVSTLSYRA